jgi:hypothetical protein
LVLRVSRDCLARWGHPVFKALKASKVSRVKLERLGLREVKALRDPLAPKARPVILAPPE